MERAGDPSVLRGYDEISRYKVRHERRISSRYAVDKRNGRNPLPFFVWDTKEVLDGFLHSESIGLHFVPFESIRRAKGAKRSNFNGYREMEFIYFYILNQ